VGRRGVLMDTDQIQNFALIVIGFVLLIAIVRWER
jgi:hypothetical protein